MPTPSDYAEALHIADTLVFTGEKLLALHRGIVYSMPIYRLYLATSEGEAIALVAVGATNAADGG